MRIGIDGSCLPNRRGFGRFARQVIRALADGPTSHEFVVVVDRPSLDQVQIPETMSVCPVDVRIAPSKAASASGRRGIQDMLAMGRATSRLGLDLMYFPASYSFFPVWNAGKVVVTLHDTLALAHPELVFSHWKGHVAWALKEHACVRWSDQIVTVSESARRDLLTMFGLEPGRVRVVPEAPDPVFRYQPDSFESRSILARYGLDSNRSYLLYVGGLSPHKNLPRMIEAFAQGAPDDVDLVLVGDMGDVFLTHVPVLRKTVSDAGIDSRVHFTGFVPDPDLAHLYSRAHALIQPSLMEGFGLPPVEAMACHTPVLSSTAGSLPEVVDAAGLYFNPTAIDSMAETIRRIFLEPGLRVTLAERAIERSAAFTWKKVGDALLSVFDSQLNIQHNAERAA